MKCELKKQHIPFTMVANTVLNDKSISFRAKGLFAYLYSKPNDYEFAWRRIAKDSTDGEASVRSALLELERAGYLERKKLVSGKIDYFIRYSPECENHTLAEKQPELENPTVGIPHSGKTSPISNIESLQSNIDTESNTAANAEEINSVLNAFKKNLNPYIRYNNKTERKAALELIQEMGLPQVLEHIKDAERFSEDEFAPRITTPYELKTKLAKLILHKKKNSPKTVTERKLTEKQQKEMNEYGFLTTN